MCTVTIVALSGRTRLACNRDELRSRVVALPPVIRETGGGRAIMPIDPPPRGTWSGLNDARRVATLLNVNLAEPPPGPRLSSRGGLVPALVACDTLGEAERVALGVRPADYPPFRLVAADGSEVLDVFSDGARLEHARRSLPGGPVLFTSSGLGDALVEGPRRALLNQMFAPGGDLSAQQDAYHRHSWPGRRHLSVCMERDDASTVSHTLIEIDARRVALTYVPDAPDRGGALGR